MRYLVIKILNDYKCINKDCKYYGYLVEELAEPHSIFQCKECSDSMVMVIPTTNFKITGEGVYSPGVKYK